jgi:hypothetical protein
MQMVFLSKVRLFTWLKEHYMIFPLYILDRAYIVFWKRRVLREKSCKSFVKRSIKNGGEGGGGGRGKESEGKARE